MIGRFLRLLRRFRLPPLVFAALMLLGCAEFQKDAKTVADVLAQANRYGDTAESFINDATFLEQEFFKAAPNSAAQAAFDAKLEDLRRLRSAAEDAASASKDLSQGELDQAWAQFNAAAEALDKDATDLGIYSRAGDGDDAGAPAPALQSHSLAAGALAVKPLAPDLPLSVRHAKGEF